MLTLTIRTDNPDAEIGLFDNDQQLVYLTWQAHRQLSETIHIKIKDSLDEIGKDWSDIEALVFYAGPGSFTGLRIGAAVANALRAGLGARLVTQTGDDWLAAGLARLRQGADEAAIPYYGSEARTTIQKK